MAASTNRSTNHERAPVCAAFVEAMREAFGVDQVIVLYVEEGDCKLGEEIDKR